MALAGSKRRRVCALAAASPRLATLSLPRMLDTWTLAVLGEMNSSAAISRLLRPAATSAEHLEFAFGEAELATPGARVARRLPLGRVVASQPDPGAPGEDRDLLGERVRAQFAASGTARRSRSAAPSRSPQASAVSAACSNVSLSG